MTNLAIAHPRAGRYLWLQLLLGFIFFVIAQSVMFITGAVVTLLSTGLDDLFGDFGPGEEVVIDVAEFSENLLANISPLGMLIGAILGSTIAVVGYLVIVGPIAGRPRQGIGGAGKLAEFAAGLGVGALLIALTFTGVYALGGYEIRGINSSPELLLPLAIGIGAAFMEEIFFRGILLRLIDHWLGSWWAIAITALIFGLVHLSNPGASLVTASALVIEAGILLGGAYLLTRRLWFAIGIHLTWNFVQSGVFSSDVSGTGAQTGIIDGSLLGPQWLSGGSMGIEGSLVAVAVGLGAGVVMLVLAKRRGMLLPRSMPPPSDPRAQHPQA